MPVLALIRERFEKEQPLDGHPDRGVPARDDRDREPDGDARGRRRRGGALRVEPAVDPGRRGRGALVEAGIDTYAIKGEDTDTFFKHINAVLDMRPQITMDDGADMVSVLHKERPTRSPRSSAAPRRPRPG